MSIISELNELKSIETEIKRLNNQLRPLRKKKKELEGTISEFIVNNQKSGIKYKGTHILPKKFKAIDRTRTKNVKEKDGADVLTKYGLTEENSKRVVQEIIEAMRGPRMEQTKLDIKKF